MGKGGVNEIFSFLMHSRLSLSIFILFFEKNLESISKRKMTNLRDLFIRDHLKSSATDEKMYKIQNYIHFIFFNK